MDDILWVFSLTCTVGKSVRCSVCEKTFCCPDHRRKHERVFHGIIRKQSFRLKPLLQAESYALEIRRSFLYLESKKTTRNDLSRKRRFSTLTTRTVQINSTTLEMGRRKIITPKRTKKLEEIEPSDGPSTSDAPYGPFSGKGQLIEDIISPVEPEERVLNKNLPGKSLMSQNGENHQHENAVFTSTPIQKRARVSSTVSQEANPLPPKSEWLSRRRKVRFSGADESLYMTADEGTSPRSGILSTVTTAIQSALKTLPGSKVQEKIKEESHTEPLKFPPIQGRRALRPTDSD